MPDQPKLPRWQSHKVVEADKITQVVVRDNDSRFVWYLAGGMLIEVSDALAGRVPPLIDATGGYYVRYSDGFESWSPAKAFEEGYTAVKEEG